MDPVMVVMFIAHHTPTLLPCNGTSWINTWFFCRSLPVTVWVHVSSEMKKVLM